MVFEAEAKGLAAAWDEHGEHAVVATVDESDVTVLNVADGSSFLVRDVVPPDHHLLGMH